MTVHRHGAHAPGVRLNPGHGEHDGSGGPVPAGAEHAGSSWCVGTQRVAVCGGVDRRRGFPARSALRLSWHGFGGAVATPGVCQRPLVPLFVPPPAEALLCLP